MVLLLSLVLPPREYMMTGVGQSCRNDLRLLPRMARTISKLRIGMTKVTNGGDERAMARAL